MDINYFMKIQNAYGTKNRREKYLNKVNKEMAKHFEDTYDTDDVLLNGKPFQLMIIRDTDGNTFKKKIKSPHDQKFNLGDYVEWNGQMWIITLIDSDDRTWNRGYMYQCTILLRWQNTNGDIIERWGYSEDFTKYSTGTKSNEIMTLGDYQYGITLPVDDETKIIKRDKRFPIDIDGVEPPDVYKLTNRKILLTDNRSFSRGGILTWTLSFSEFNPNTDKFITLPNGTQAWICDYHSSTSNSSVITSRPNETAVLSAEIIGNKNIKVGFSRTYTVKFTDENGNEVDWNKVDFVWRIKENYPIEKMITGNKIELMIKDENFIGSSFLLEILDHDNSVYAKTIINIVEGF